MPGFWVCLVVTAFLLTPPFDGWHPRSALRYVTGNWLLFIHQYGIGTTLAQNPHHAWDGSLWTLYPEALCYVIIGGWLSFAIVRRYSTLTAGLFVFATMYGFLARTGFDGTVRQLGHLVPFFMAGVLLRTYRDRVLLNAPGAGIALATVLTLGGLHLVRPFGALPIAYLLLWVAVAAPSRIRRVGSKNDVSYGVYIYAFPIQQILVVHGVHRHGYLAMAIASVSLTLPLAWLSWLMVERPSMRAAQFGMRAIDRSFHRGSAFTLRVSETDSNRPLHHSAPM